MNFYPIQNAACGKWQWPVTGTVSDRTARNSQQYTALSKSTLHTDSVADVQLQ